MSIHLPHTFRWPCFIMRLSKKNHKPHICTLVRVCVSLSFFFIIFECDVSLSAPISMLFFLENQLFKPVVILLLLLLKFLLLGNNFSECLYVCFVRKPPNGNAFWYRFNSTILYIDLLTTDAIKRTKQKHSLMYLLEMTSPFTRSPYCTSLHFTQMSFIVWMPAHIIRECINLISC